jgi:hypothetical protein
VYFPCHTYLYRSTEVIEKGSSLYNYFVCEVRHYSETLISTLLFPSSFQVYILWFRFAALKSLEMSGKHSCKAQCRTVVSFVPFFTFLNYPVTLILWTEFLQRRALNYRNKVEIKTYKLHVKELYRVRMHQQLPVCSIHSCACVLLGIRTCCVLLCTYSIRCAQRCRFSSTSGSVRVLWKLAIS